jgi:hypothetical protein
MAGRTSQSVLLTLVGLPLVMGCAPRSYVTIQRPGVKCSLMYVDYSSVGGIRVHWAVGDNAEAYRPALYAPYPAPYHYWCMGLYLSKTDPKAVFVDRVCGEDRLLVYELQDVTIESSDRAIIGRAKAHVLSVDRGGKTLDWDLSPAFPRDTDLEFVLYTQQQDHDWRDLRLKVILDDLRPIAEGFLFRDGR